MGDVVSGTSHEGTASSRCFRTRWLSAVSSAHLEAEAKERQREAGANNLKNFLVGQKVAPLDEATNKPDERSAVQAAKMLSTNKQYIKDAKSIRQKHPDIFEAIKTGDINIPEAKKMAKLPIDILIH